MAFKYFMEKNKKIATYRFMPLGLLTCLFLICYLFPFDSFLITESFSAVLEQGSVLKKSQIEQIESDLSREKEQFLKYDSKEKDLLIQLSDIEKTIEEKRVFLREIQDKIKDNKEQVNIKQKELASIKDSMAQTEKSLAKRLIAFYKYAKRGYLYMISTTESIDQLNSRMKYIGLILNDDYQIMKKMSQEYATYNEEISKIEQYLETVAKLKETESSRYLSIKEDLEKKVILLAKIHKEKEFYGTAVQELELAAQNLKQTIINVEKEQNTETIRLEGFSHLKGKLPLPLEGKIIKDTAALETGNRGDQKGIYILGNLGVDISSVYSGRIDFSDQVKGYGQVVIINHGSRFFTIYTNLLNREKESGETVKEGEIIGQVGETGLPIGSGLYFEIRQGGTYLDPMDWLKVH